MEMKKKRRVTAVLTTLTAGRKSFVESRGGAKKKFGLKYIICGEHFYP